jgi:uroporphyrinogen-III synthase
LAADTAAPRARERLQRVIVTRPEPEASVWAQALRVAGWPAQALPLMEIAEPTDAATQQRLQQARAHWLDADAIMFVSAAAVQHFFSAAVQAPQASQAASVRTRFWAPGPGTARVLAQALAVRGLGTEHIDAPAADAVQFDSEALWPVVAPQLKPGQRIWIVRGASKSAAAPSEPSDPSASEPAAQALAGNGRDWLIQQCQAAGAQVQACVAYERRAPPSTPALQALLQSATASGSLWLFSSSEALVHLRQLAPAAVWTQASALATHPRIAASARAAGFGHVIDTRPALPDVLRALESTASRP